MVFLVAIVDTQGPLGSRVGLQRLSGKGVGCQLRRVLCLSHASPRSRKRMAVQGVRFLPKP